MAMNSLALHNQLLISLSAEDRLHWAFENFQPNKIAVSSSFGVFSSALLHLVSKVQPDAQILFLDTGFHFRETIKFTTQLKEQLNLTIRIVEPSVSKTELYELLGDTPWETDHDKCCTINKVEPMNAILGEFDLWISGIRSSQTESRNNLDILQKNKRGQMKFHPILDWSSKQIYDYITKNNLSLHPLFNEGYSSIGCTHCTFKTGKINDDRSGRWNGKKEECGLHL